MPGESQMKRVVAVLLLLIVVNGFTFGQKRKKIDLCPNAETQFEMNQCAARDYRAADAVLNRTYQRLVAMLNDEEKSQLKTAQTAWLKYRDSNCEFVGDEFKGGSMRPLIYASCLADMTRKRTVEIKNQIKERKL